MSRYAPLCSYGTCTRPTRSSDGRCYQHQGVFAAVPKPVIAPPKPTSSAAPVTNRIEETDELGYTTVSYFDAKGRPSRLDGPAVQTTDENGQVVLEEWCINGLHSRTDGPAITRVRPRNSAVVESWHLAGVMTREDGPARVTTHRSDHRAGEVFEEWFRDDVKHRDDGPAERMIRPDGEVYLESYYYAGDKNRVDGPSYRRVDRDGQITKTFYRRGQAGGYSTLWGMHRALAEDLRLGRPEAIVTLRTSPLYREILDAGVTPEKLLETTQDGIESEQALRAVLLDGAPVEWARAFEEASAP